ncbi:MAG: ERCC4 domain-containing protein, partial [Planctomycetota bacterium]
MSKVTVKVDDRERGAGVIRYLRERDDVSLTIARLETGDYEVGDRLLFERKTLQDFARSIIQGRLFSQAGRLAGAQRRAAVVLEGTGRDLRNISVEREAIQGALINLSIIMDIPVLRSKSAPETARVMLYAARQVRRRITGGVYRHGYRPKGKRKRQLYVLQGLPEVGPARAEKLLEAFGNVERVMAADMEDLTEV